MPAGMIANLNGESVSIERGSTGSYVNGTFVPGGVTATAAIMSIQPMTGRELQALPEGRRADGFMKGYIDFEVETIDESILRPEDIVVWRTRRFQVHQAEPWYGGANTIGHWKVFLIEEVEA